MAESRSLPPELIDQIFSELIVQCCEEVDRSPTSPSNFWLEPCSHPVKAFGNACSSFRQRAQHFMWDKVLIDEGQTLDHSWQLYRYLRCVNPNALAQTREFTYESYIVTNYGGPPDQLWEFLYEGKVKPDDEASSGMPLREDGSLDLDDEAPLVAFSDKAALGKVKNESDVWGLLRFIFSRLVNAHYFRWTTGLRMYAEFRGVSLGQAIAALPKLKCLDIDQSWYGGEFYLESLDHFRNLEELRIQMCKAHDYDEDVDLWYASLRNLILETKTFRRLTTCHPAVFADARIIIAAAQLDITAIDDEDGDEAFPHSMGVAAAALRPTLLEASSKHHPPWITTSEVSALFKLPVLEPLSKWLVQDTASRIAETFNEHLRDL